MIGRLTAFQAASEMLRLRDKWLAEHPALVALGFNWYTATDEDDPTAVAERLAAEIAKLRAEVDAMKSRMEDDGR